MNKTQLKVNWMDVKKKIKQEWRALTDEDLRYEEGQEDQLIKRIQQKTGESHEVIQRKFDEWTR